MGKRASSMLVFVLTSLAAGQVGEILRITGQVQDNQIRMIEGAEVAVVELHGDGYSAPKSAKLLETIKTTDDEGRFAFNVWVEPRHDVLIVARKAGLALGWEYIHREHPFLTQPGTTVNCSIALLPPYSIAGRLRDATGQAVASANVQVLVYIGNGAKDLYAPRDWLNAKTDVHGRFAFGNLPIDATVKFLVETPQSDIAYIYPPTNLGGNAGGGYRVDWEDVELKLPPAATVQGTVMDKTTKQGISGMRLMLSPENPSKCEWRFRAHEVFSGANGSFEVEGVPPGTHILHFVSGLTDWVGKNVPISIDGLSKTISARVLIEKGTPLELIVRDQTTGKVLPNITVYVDNRQNDQQNDVFIQFAKTDARGKVRLYVPKGQHKIHAWGGNYHDGLKGKGRPLNVTSPRTAPVEIWVKPRLPLVKGIVVDGRGQPVENASVTVGLGQRVLTDKQGRFEAMQNPLYPSHLLVVRDPRRHLAGASFFYNALREMRVVLRPSIAVTGRVIDEWGRGIADAKVNLQLNCQRPGRPRDIHGTAHLRGTRTDSEGYYRLDTVMPLKRTFTYHISYEATDYGSTRYSLKQRMKQGEAFDIPDMQLVSLDGRISGVVLDEHDHPVANKPVFAGSTAGGAHDDRATSTDEQGRFKFNRIPQGPVTLQAGFGQGPDAAYIFAQSGDNVTIKLGNHFKNYVPPDSLVGHPLPDLGALEIGFDNQRIKNKRTLVVFVDYTERASQVAIGLLKRFSAEFRQKQIVVACIQVTPVDEDKLKAWKKENKISFPIDTVPGKYMSVPPILKQTPDIMNVLRQRWGVRSLPWTILTDKKQNIKATGLNIFRVNTLIHEDSHLPLRRIPAR